MIEPGQVAAMRKRLSLSQAGLARMSGVSQSLIAKIEAGKVDPTFTKMKAIHEALSNGHREGGHKHARDVMARPVVTMFATETVSEAIDHLARHGFSQLPVMDEGVIVGTVTEDALLHFVSGVGNGSAPLARPVREVMSPALPQVPPETELDALESLLDAFPAVLVSANGRVQGIVTRADLLRAAMG